LGLAQVPDPIAAGAVKAGKLERVLEAFAPTAPGVFLYYPGGRQMKPKLRAFIDHVKSPSGSILLTAAGKVRAKTNKNNTA
jgi:DNA-binding transcriptional LysR family regulator